MTNPNTMTEHARRGDHVAAALETALARIFSGYTVVVTRPEASTRGGERATLHLQLVQPDGRSFVVGSLNPTERRATLRTLGYTLELSKRRLGRELVVPPREYLRFLNVATQVLQDFGLGVDVAAYDRQVS